MRWRGWFTREHRDEDFERELRTHLELEAEEKKEAGLPADQARYAARRDLGNPTQIQEKMRATWRWTWIETFGQDLRYGWRMLIRQPLFTMTAVLTLGLVIGANGAIFSVLEAVLLRPLPYAKPQQLVLLFGKNRTTDRDSISPADLDDWGKAHSLQSVSALQGQSVNLTGVDEPARLIGGFVSSTFFPMLGVRPMLGRLFAAGEDRPGAARVCVMSYGLWRGRFGGDPNLIGRPLILNGETYTVIGILPATFQSPFIPSDVWLPIQAYPNYVADRAHNSAIALGRLADGFSIQQARAELATITRQLAAEYPNTDRDRGAVVLPLHETLVEDLRPVLMLLAGAVGCVLLIGCANVAGLLLAQAFGRRQELAVRLSLGAGQIRLMRQLLTESGLLGLMGGLFGVAVAAGGIRLMLAYSDDIPKDLPVGLDVSVLIFLLLLSLLAGLLFGLAPALLSHREATSSLRQRGAGASHGRLRGTLVVGQVAFALILLVGAGLMVKSLQKLVSIDPGFKTDHLLTLEYRLPKTRYPSGAQQTQFHDEVITKVEALPGVQSAGDIRALPFSGNSASRIISFPDRPPAPAEAPWVVQYNAVSPSYFVTAGMPLLEGRFFTRSDGPDAARVVMVSKSFEAKFWPHHSAVGRQVNIPKQDLDLINPAMATATVVGVIPDTKLGSLTETATPQLYVPYAQDPFIFATLVVKTKGDPMAMTRAVQRAIWSIDKDQPMWKIRTMESLVAKSVQNRRYVMFLLGCFSMLALVLAAVGLYGVLAYSVTQRTAEFGIRMALGAAPAEILSAVVKNGARLTALGLVTGAGAALVLSRYLRSQLYEVSTSDPAVYGAICALLLVVGLLAAALPARRASRVDPAIALRHE